MNKLVKISILSWILGACFRLISILFTSIFGSNITNSWTIRIAEIGFVIVLTGIVGYIIGIFVEIWLDKDL